MIKFRLVTDFVESTKQFGAIKALFDFAYRAGNRLFGMMILNVVVLSADTVNAESLENSYQYRIGFIDAAPLRSLAEKYPDAVSDSFIDSAFKEGDRCFGIIDGDNLVSFGWYSHHATPINERLRFHFDPTYVYMYKGYTVPGYRGQKLHALGMAHALLASHDEGDKGIVSYIEANNFRSISSCERLGYKLVGRIYTCKLFGRYLSYVTRGCKPYKVSARPYITMPKTTEDKDGYLVQPNLPVGL